MEIIAKAKASGLKIFTVAEDIFVRKAWLQVAKDGRHLARKKHVDALAKDATACSKAMESATVCWASCLPLEAAVIATSAHVISAWQIAAAMAPAHGTNLAGTGDGSATGGLPPP
mmetsp:Transcript_28555/g.73293  ORF Transcript_28555/g.73293 Transcript_28555/m.73293 type:complete len:115 (+) Transcript_28555:722-1066(+)